jgi:hypothetical protein
MILLSREQRGGEPLACAFGCTEQGGRMGAGLLFVREAAPPALHFVDPQTQNVFYLALPADFVNLTEPGYGEREPLEPAHD